MSDFECMPIGTAKRLAELEAENNGLRFALSRQGKSTMPEMVSLRAEVERLRKATQLCDKHAPNGGTVSACVICSGQKLSYALSRISYLCEPPNEMECSSYDLHYNEDAVVAQVERLKQDLDRLSRGTWSIEIARQSKIASELRAEVERLRAQQAELLEALERISGFTLSQFMGPMDMALECVDVARSAVAKRRASDE